MIVEVLPNVTIMKLHGNEIAYKYHDPKRTISIITCNLATRITKGWLNAIDGVDIHQEKGQWFLNGKEWDGELTDV